MRREWHMPSTPTPPLPVFDRSVPSTALSLYVYIPLTSPSTTACVFSANGPARHCCVHSFIAPRQEHNRRTVYHITSRQSVKTTNKLKIYTTTPRHAVQQQRANYKLRHPRDVRGFHAHGIFSNGLPINANIYSDSVYYS